MQADTAQPMSMTMQYTAILILDNLACQRSILAALLECEYGNHISQSINPQPINQSISHRVREGGSH